MAASGVVKCGDGGAGFLHANGIEGVSVSWATGVVWPTVVGDGPGAVPDRARAVPLPLPLPQPAQSTDAVASTARAAADIDEHLARFMADPQCGAIVARWTAERIHGYRHLKIVGPELT
jgi:hypothetical protein